MSDHSVEDDGWPKIGTQTDRIEFLLRPPDPDEMPGRPWAPHPESVRGKAISYYIELERVRGQLRRTRLGRLLLFVDGLYRKIGLRL